MRGVTTCLLLIGSVVDAWLMPTSTTRHIRIETTTSLATSSSSSFSSDTTSHDMETGPTSASSSESYSRESWINGFHTVDSEGCYPISLPADFPKDISGTFFQNGHAKFQVGDELVMHPFDGDGMVSALTIVQGNTNNDDGGDTSKAWFRNRFVQTPGYREELRANKICYRGVFGTAKNRGAWYSNIFDLRQKNLANTHVLFHSSSSATTTTKDQLFALWEGGRPFELDPVTLETRNNQMEVDLDGALQPGEGYAAHYKIDPDTGHVIGFATGVIIGPDPAVAHRFTVYEHDTELRLVSKETFELPGFGLAHDMAMTPRYVCAFQAPIQFDPVPFVLGQKGVAECISTVDQATQSRLFLVPRSSQKTPPVTIPLPLCFTFHTANAFEQDDDVLVVDAVVSEDMIMTSPEDAGSTKYPERPIWETFDLTLNRYQLRRFYIDVQAQRVLSVTSLSNDQSANVEFPVIHPDYVSKPYQYAYVGAGASRTVGQPIQGLTKIDVRAGRTVQRWMPESEHEFLGEVCFVPRGNPNDEDDGYLMGYLMNGRDETTTLCVFDCKQIDAGPVSRVPVPLFLSHALHGVFVPDYTPDLEAASRSFR